MSTRIRKMNRVFNPDHMYLRRFRGMNAFQVHMWVKQNVQFIPEPTGQDEYLSLDDIGKKGGGDCEDICLLESSILTHLEIPHQILVTSFPFWSQKHMLIITTEPPGILDSMFFPNLFAMVEEAYTPTKNRILEESIGSMPLFTYLPQYLSKKVMKR